MSDLSEIDILFINSILDDVPEGGEHKFSLRYKIRKRNIIRAYKNGLPTADTARAPFRMKYVVIAVVAAVLVAVAGCGIAYFTSDAFRGEPHSEFTQLFATNTEGCPSIIEEKYELSVVPEGYELSEVIKTSTGIYTEYKNEEGHRFLFNQYVKERFDLRVNTEGFELQKTKINGCDAVFVEYDMDTGALLFWDNEDYVLMLDGTFTADELIKLAECNEINGFKNFS